MVSEKRSSLFGLFVNDEEKSSITTSPFVTYKKATYARTFVPGHLFQPSLIFEGELRQILEKEKREIARDLFGFFIGNKEKR